MGCFVFANVIIVTNICNYLNSTPFFYKNSIKNHFLFKIHHLLLSFSKIISFSNPFDCKYLYIFDFSAIEIGFFVNSVFLFMVSSIFWLYSSMSMVFHASRISGSETFFNFKCCLILIFPQPFIRNLPNA